ncbi:MAG: Lrp/AsnC family transcriptional regulator [Candidatus Lokiarchaeota archaeon]|nr:Lrp/AsnC family transcriptional regulator [Candidatus Harpocratesius repetitus]
MRSIIDEKDIKILNALKQDASLSVAKLSDKTGLPATTIHNRVKKLKENRILDHYTIAVDKDRLYGNIVAFILIKTFQANQRKIAKHLLNISEVEEAAIITGDQDLMIKFRCRSISDLDKFIIDELRKIPGIQSSHTMISLENYEK